MKLVTSISASPLFRARVRLVAILFTLCVALGYAAARGHEAELLRQLEATAEELGPLISAGPVTLFLIILANNAIKSYLFMVAGYVTSAIPYLFVVINALTLGLFIHVMHGTIGLPLLAIGLLPHGIIEIPVILLAAALGLSVRPWLTLGNTRQQHTLDLASLNRIYLTTVFPLLFVAAAVEVFVSMAALGYLIDKIPG